MRADDIFRQVLSQSARELVDRKRVRLQQRVTRSVAVDSKLAVTIADESIPITTGNSKTYLLMNGMESRLRRNQIPLWDADIKAETVRAICGSVRSLRIVGSQLRGVIVFSSDPEGQAIREAFASGKRKSLEMVADIREGIELRAGEFYGDIAGPAVVATKWTPLKVATRGDH
jgi:hypothetical protein